MAKAVELIRPRWPVPQQVVAFSSTRVGGVSASPYDSLNLGEFNGDVPSNVTHNRARLRQYAGLPADPIWLKQVHGRAVVKVDGASANVTADAIWTDVPGQVCAVLTADCLPVLLADGQARTVAAVHCGWRGLAAGILENAVHALPVDASALVAWLGPAIGPNAFEVDIPVREAFLDRWGEDESCFRANRPGHWLADLAGLARRRLKRLGVGRVYGGAWCTYSQPKQFFSYRRESVTGRMATVIWMV